MIMQIVYQAGAPAITGANPSRDFSVAAAQTPLSVGGSSGTEAASDVIYTTQIGTGTDNNFRIDLSIGLDASSFEHTITSATPAVCSVDESTHQVTRVANGLCSIDVSVPRLGTRRINQQMTRSGASTTRTGVSSYAAGSLLKYLWDQSNAACAAVIPGESAQRYLGGGNALSEAIHAGLSLTHLTGQRWITPHHYIGAAHTFGVGYYSMYARMPDGSPVMSATPTTQVVIGGVTQPYGKHLRVIGNDTAIHYSPGAYGGTLAKLLPSTWRTKLPTANDLARIPVWAVLNSAGMAGWGKTGDWLCPLDLSASLAVARPVKTGRAELLPGTSPGMVPGHSGSLIFMSINTDAVLCASANFGGNATQDFYGDMVEAINTVLNQLSAAYVAAGGTDAVNGGYTVQTISLSGFTSY